MCLGCILWVPVQYKLKADAIGDIDMLKGHGKYSWLFHIVSGRFAFVDGYFVNEVKFLGVKLKRKEKNKESKEDDKEIEKKNAEKKAKKSKMQEHNALRLQQEINAIVDENAAKNKEIREEKEAQRAERKAAKEEKAKQVAAKKAEFYRPVKKSDDPNLVYGRDFEGDEIELSQVLGEMGEIIFRGYKMDTSDGLAFTWIGG